jgi:peptidyl-prolyl cis-trans isomerase C
MRIHLLSSKNRHISASSGNRTRPRKHVALALTVLAPLLLAGPTMALAQGAEPAHTPRSDSDRIVAEIDGELVTAAELDGFTAQYLRQKLYHGGSEEELAALRRDALDKLIERRLLVTEAKRRGIGGDFGAVEAEIARLEARYGGSESWEQLEPRLPELRAKLLESSRIEVLEAQIRQVEAPDEATLRAFYETNTDLFTTPRANRLSTILLSVHPGAPKEDWAEAESRAKELREEILQGADFGEMAKEHSTHVSAEKGGDIGFLHEGELAPAIQVAVDKLEIGGVTEALHVLEGYVLFHLEGRRPAELQPFENVKERASGLYVRETGNERWNALRAQLRNDAKIVINQQKAEADGSMP